MSNIPQSNNPEYLIKEIAPFISDEDFDKSLLGAMISVMDDLPDWTSTAFKKKFPGLESGYIICKTEECPYASVCPIIRDINTKYKYQKDKKFAALAELADKPCRLEQIEVGLYLANLLKEHHVTVADTSDQITILRIVKTVIQLNRIERELSVFGVSGEQVIGVNNKGVEIKDRRANDLLKTYTILDKNLLSMLSSLNATRKDKVNTVISVMNGKGGLKDFIARPKDSMKDIRNGVFSAPKETIIDVEVNEE